MSGEPFVKSFLQSKSILSEVTKNSVNRKTRNAIPKFLRTTVSELTVSTDIYTQRRFAYIVNKCISLRYILS